MARWNLIDEYGTGNVLDVVEGSYRRARERKTELVREYGPEIIIAESF